MMPSAIATQNIYPGAAVAQKGDTVSLASPGVLASHIVTNGGPMSGIVSMLARGNVFLDNWTLATGSRFLMIGKTYFVGIGGKLVATGGQPVGIATTRNNLSVTIQNSQAASSSSSSSSTDALQTQINELQVQINAIVGQVPKIYSGTFAIDNASNSGSVTGLGITHFAPTKAVVSVKPPASGLVLTANAIDGTITKAGFDFVLSGITDSADYKLDFTLSP